MLNHYKARYYDPETGRFLQVDPIGYEDQMNLYAYVGNDPVNMIDPSGHCEVSRIGTASGSICRGSKEEPSSENRDSPSDGKDKAANDNRRVANDNRTRPSTSENSKKSSTRAGRVGMVGGTVDGAIRAFNAGQRQRLKDDYEKCPECFVLVVRFYGGGARVGGRSWGPQLMAVSPDARHRWGIPKVNTMDRIAYGAIRRESLMNGDVITRGALPIPEEGTVGGGTEYLITVPDERIPSVVMIYKTDVNRGPK